MHARVRDLTQPAPHRRVRRMLVRRHAGLPQRRDKRHPEATLQIADEPLDFALRLGPVRLAQTRQRAGMFEVIEEAGMEAMRAPAIGVALQHDRLHAVEQHFRRHPAKRHERVLMARDQRLDPLVVAELNVSRPAPAERRDEHFQFVTADRRPVGLHLLTRFSLKPDNRFRYRCRHQAAHEHLHARHAARITPRLDLPQQHRRRDAIRARGSQPVDDVSLVRIQLLQSLRCPLPGRGSLATANVPPDRVP